MLPTEEPWQCCQGQSEKTIYYLLHGSVNNIQDSKSTVTQNQLLTVRVGEGNEKRILILEFLFYIKRDRSQSLRTLKPLG